MTIDPTLIERVLAEIDHDEAVAFLQELVRIPTVNPPGDVRAAIQRCTAKLSTGGFDCRFVELDEQKPNLIARLGDGGPTLLFNAHLDVVPIGDESVWRFDPFAAEINDSRIYGRGALDDKASVAAQVMAGIAIARSGVPLRGTLIVSEVADEEIGGLAGADLIVKQPDIAPDFVIVGEPTLNRICLGERGGALTVIEVTGRTAHGALPWEGANAIEGMAVVIAALRRELWPRLATRTHSFFHHSSASVNGISGGVKDNMVPDRCSISIDRRFVPGEDPAESLNEMRAVVAAAIADVPGCSAVVRYGGEVNRARMSPPDSLLVQGMLSANRLLGLSEELTGFSMATDGRFFAAAGYPTIIYGPGDPTLAHVPNESIGIEELLDATRAYALACLALIG